MSRIPWLRLNALCEPNVEIVIMEPEIQMDSLNLNKGAIPITLEVARAVRGYKGAFGLQRIREQREIVFVPIVRIHVSGHLIRIATGSHSQPGKGPLHRHVWRKYGHPGQ